MSATKEEALSPARPVSNLNEFHKEVMMSYCFDSRHQSVLGGQSPKEVVLTSQYIPLSIAENEEMEGDGNRSLSSLENTLSTVLSPSQDKSRPVILCGPAGVGKTTALQKMLNDWAETKDLQQFVFVFPFAVRDLVSVEREMSLEELILKQHGHFPHESLALILQRPQSLLFIFDGLEQYQYRLESSSDSPLCSEPNQPALVHVLISSLVHGELLKGASIIISVRSADSLSLFSEADCHHVRVLGFSLPQRKAYFNLVFSDPRNAEKIFHHTEQRMGFYGLCGHPIFCWIMCSLLNEALEAGDDLPETLTQVYAQTSASLFGIHSLAEVRARDLMLGLGKMAAQNLVNKQVVFSQKDITAFGLQQFLTSPILSAFLFMDGDPASENCIFSFISPIVQEFCIAVSYYLGMPGGESVEEFLGKFEGCVEFLEVLLSGLSDAVQRKPLEGIVGKFNEDRTASFIEWLKNTSVEALHSCLKNRHLRCFRLLHQSQNHALVKEIAVTHAERLGISYGGLSVWDSVALNYVVKFCGGLEQLNLYSSRSLTEDIMQHLIPAINLSSKLILSQNTLSSSSYVRLASAIHKGKTVELDLSYNRKMGDSGAKALFEGLGNSNLQNLWLVVCGLTAACCENLASVLAQPSTQLRKLHLRANQLQDQGLIWLCRGLQSPHCKLLELRLENCGITDRSMKVLSQTISSGNCTLAILALSNNEITDTGMQWLSHALRDSKANLRHLLVSDCNLTDACCEGLAAMLVSEDCLLTELDLSLNDLTDSGAVQLCEPLKLQGCSLEKLRLTHCELSEVTFKELGSVLRSGNSRLKALDVGVNKVGNAGAKYLWEALAHNCCKLEHLDLEMNDLTDASLEDISVALRSNTSLKKLVLKNNSLTDASVPSLVQLIQESRTMQEINLQYNDFSEDVFEILDTCGRIKY